MKKVLISIICLAFLIGGIGSYKYIDLYEIKKEKEKRIVFLERENSDLYEKIENIPKNKENNEEIEKLKKEKISLEEEIKNIKENKIDFKLLNSYKVNSLEVGTWNLSDKEKTDILKSFNKEKSFYEIIPIVDNKAYLNDPDSLKQLGLSRKRAASAVVLLRSLNPNNKIFISTEVIYAENERGFIINQFN